MTHTNVFELAPKGPAVLATSQSNGIAWLPWASPAPPEPRIAWCAGMFVVILPWLYCPATHPPRAPPLPTGFAAHGASHLRQMDKCPQSDERVRRGATDGVGLLERYQRSCCSLQHASASEGATRRDRLVWARRRPALVGGVQSRFSHDRHLVPVLRLDTPRIRTYVRARITLIQRTDDVA